MKRRLTLGTQANPEEAPSRAMFKIILIGNQSVGKTNLISRYVYGKLPKYDQPTLGLEYTSRAVQLPDGSEVRAQIWDTAGQEKFRAVTSAHYRKAFGAIVVFSLVDRESFEAIEKWILEITDNADQNICMLLVGNKLDLVKADPKKRQVSIKEAERICQQHGMQYVETSAQENINVQNMVQVLVQDIYDTRQQELEQIQERQNKMSEKIIRHEDQSFDASLNQQSNCKCM